MTKILQAAGAPTTAIAKVQEIVDTCIPCRNWATPSPKSATTSRLIEAFNHTVQHDLMFVSSNPGQHQHTKQDPRAEPWQHLIDCCNRLSQATILSSKTTNDLIRTFEMAWVRPYGPPLFLESDQESGLVTDEAKLYLQRAGTTLRVKGVDAHAKMAEKHHHLLRLMYLRIASQAAEEGINAPKDLLLTAALTAKNSLLTVGNSTPMLSTLGQQPPLLPDIDQPPAALDDSHTGPDGFSRGRHRIREIATQACIEESAIRRMKEAATTKTRQCAQAKDLETGMEVEFFRQPANKDTQGWRGPAEMVKMDADGTCHIKWQGTTFTCRLQDVRRALTYIHLMYLTFLRATDSTQPWDILMDHITNMIRGTQQTIAIIRIQGNTIMSNTAKRNHTLLRAILHVASRDLQLADCVGARIAHGVQHLGPIKHVEHSLLTWWPHHRPDDIHYSHQPAMQHIDCRKLQHNIPVTQLCICQYLCSNPDDTNVIQQTFPDIPNIGAQPPTTTTPHPAMAGLIPTIPPMQLPPMQPAPMQPPQPQQPPQAIDHQQAATAIIQAAAQTARKRERSVDSSASGNPAPHCSQCLDPDDEFDTTDQPTHTPQADPQNVPVPDDDIDPDDMSDTDEACYVQPELTFYTPPPQLTLDQITAQTPITQQDIWYLDDGFAPDLTQYDTERCELVLSPQMAYLSGFCDRELEHDEELILVATRKQVQGVITRKCDNLSAEDIAKHLPEVEAAKMDELRRWYDLNGFRRGQRATATNVVD